MHDPRKSLSFKTTVEKEGRIAIPREIFEALSLKEDEIVEVEIRVLRKARPAAVIGP